uniref:Protein kinase domain-containing protein n=1 Tax=Parastrongyloides trichosuri TaxID=131310 RepID=A0A0N4Z2L5_PARTI
MNILPFSVSEENAPDQVMVTNFLRQGKFSAVYECKIIKENDITTDGVIKISFDENYEVEMDVLFTINPKNSERFHTLIREGSYSKMGQRYFVYSPIGMNLGDYINMQRNFKMDPRDCLTILTEIMKGLTYLHKRGFVYKNVKPSGFCLDYDKDNPGIITRIYLWEFESCHRYNFESYKYYTDIDRMKNIYEKRKKLNINGSKYCSIREHNKDCEPHYGNDIESLYYLGVKMFEGTLPWSSILLSNSEVTIEKKKSLRNVDNSFYHRTPILYTSILRIIDKIFECEMNYKSMIINILNKTKLQLESNSLTILNKNEEEFYRSVLTHRKDYPLPKSEVTVRLNRTRSPSSHSLRSSNERSNKTRRQMLESSTRKKSLQVMFNKLFKKKTDKSKSFSKND